MYANPYYVKLLNLIREGSDNLDELKRLIGVSDEYFNDKVIHFAEHDYAIDTIKFYINRINR